LYTERWFIGGHSAREREEKDKGCEWGRHKIPKGASGRGKNGLRARDKSYHLKSGRLGRGEDIRRSGIRVKTRIEKKKMGTEGL